MQATEIIRNFYEYFLVKITIQEFHDNVNLMNLKIVVSKNNKKNTKSSKFRDRHESFREVFSQNL